MDSPDFRVPQSALQINGQLVQFRPVYLKGEGVLYVPTGVYKPKGEPGWRVSFFHDGAIEEKQVPDRQAGPNESLARAWRVLRDILLSKHPPEQLHDELGAPGPEDAPAIDTGMQGVILDRAFDTAVKLVRVMVNQVIWVDGEKRTFPVCVGTVTEDRNRANPGLAAVELMDLLEQAYAIRRYGQSLEERHEYPGAVVTYADVPEAYRQAPSPTYSIELGEVFSSYVSLVDVRFRALPRYRLRRGGGIAALQRRDLREPPGRHIHINGFSFVCKAVHLGNDTFYLPRYLYRARGEWRLRIPHSEGVWCDEVADMDGPDGVADALREAWLFLISELLNREPPTERMAPSRYALLETGVRGLIVEVNRNKPARPVRVAMRQSVAPSHPAQTTRNLGRWPFDELEQSALDDALRWGAAIAAYRASLVTEPGSLPVIEVTRDIPDQYWPAEPVYRITLDDIQFHLEQTDSITHTLADSD